MHKGKAIILGCQHGGAAIARSLSKFGVELLVLTYDRREAGLASRHVKDWSICPHPRDQKLFITDLEKYAKDWNGALIFSTTDYFAEAVSKNKDRLSQHFCISDPDWHHARIFLEKDLTYQLADQVGVPHPVFIKPNSMRELDREIPRLQLPTMIKPVISHQFCETFNQKLFINETVDELRENFQRTLDAGIDAFICEIIPGSDFKTLETVQMYINSWGALAATFCCIKLRQTPPMYGVIRVGRSMEPSNELIEQALKLLRKISYKGYASVEFKRDPRDNQLKLIEVNIRTLRMAQLPIGSGVDFPRMIFQDLLHDEQVIINEYNVNTYYIDVIADIADCIRFDTDRNLSRYLEPYRARHRTFPYMHLSDPMPFFKHIVTGGLKAILKALFFVR